MKKVKALLLPTDGDAQLIEVEPTLATLQGLIGGHVEGVTLAEDWHMYCDEDYVAKGLPPNDMANQLARVAMPNFHQILCGPVLVMGSNNEDGSEADLPDRVLKPFLEHAARQELPTPPDDAKCDFCFTSEVAAVVRAQPFAHDVGNLARHRLDGNWAACQTCASLVRQERWGDLLERAFKSYHRRHQPSGSAARMIRSGLRRMYEQLDENLIGVEWLPGRKPKSPAAPQATQARPSVRFAKDVPEAQSKLIRFLEHHAAEEWTTAFKRRGYRGIVGVHSNGALIYDAGTGFHIPQEYVKDTPAETAKVVAAWQAWAVRESALHFVNDTMTTRVLEAAEDLPDFEVEQELVPHEIGLLCWAKPVAFHEQLQAHIVGMSWVPFEHGLWLTFYQDTALETYSTDEERVKKGWLVEAGTIAIPWGSSSLRDHHSTGMPIYPFMVQAFRTLLTTWLFMADTIVAEIREEALPPKDARKIRRRGHPAPAVSYVSLRKVVRPKVEEDKAEATGRRKSEGHWDVIGHWRHYKAERYKPEVRKRPQWIEPYNQGDPNGPYVGKKRAKVYTLHK